MRGIYEKTKGSGVWWVRHADASGLLRREKAGSKSAAINLHQKRKNEALQGRKLPEKLRARPVTLRKIGEAALEYVRKEKSTAKHDEGHMKLILEHFGDRAAESILPEDFERWLNDKADAREWSQGTRNRYISTLKLTYRLAEKNGKIKTNPARLLRQHKENNTRVRYLNQYQPFPTEVDYLQDCKDEESRLRKVICTEFAYHLPEFEIALHTGMRRSEQYGATWSNVNFLQRVLTVPRSKHGETRHVRLNATALAMFKFLQGRASGTDRVFLRMQNDKPLRQNDHWFMDAVKKAGIRHFTWHDVRHTFASRLAMSGVDIRTISDLMGHKNIQMTMRYAHLAPSHQQAAVETLTSFDQPTDTITGTAEKRTQ